MVIGIQRHGYPEPAQLFMEFASVNTSTSGGVTPSEATRGNLNPGAPFPVPYTFWCLEPSLAES